MAILVNTHERNKSKYMADGAARPDFDHQLTIKLPNGRVLRVVARSVLIAIIIVAIPWIESSIGSSSEAAGYVEWARPVISDGPPSLQALFQDLSDNALLKLGAKVLLFLSSEDPIPIFPSDYGIDVKLISHHDEEQWRSIPDETFDFAYVVDFRRCAEFVDHALKIGGLAAFWLSPDPAQAFRVPSNFRIVYIHKYDETFVVIRKVSPSPSAATDFHSSSKRRLCAQKSLLESLPSSLQRPFNYYLPGLVAGSQFDNWRRVIIAVGAKVVGQ